MTKCQITCKSLQKSSKCQNFLRVWHLVIFRAEQFKKPPCTYVSSFSYKINTCAVSGEIRDSINHVKRDMANQYAGGKGGQAQAKVSCPEVSCTSTTVLLAALAAQLVILMAYLMYRDNKEHQAKKFY